MENSSKARQGSKTKEQSTHFKVRKFSHDAFQGANSLERVAISHTSKQGAKLIKVRNLFKRRYPTRRPPTEPVLLPTKLRGLLLGPAKRTKFSGPGEPSHAPQAEPPTEELGFLGYSRDRYQASHDSRTTDRGQLDCRDRSFHSETYFDIEALRQQPELRDSFRLLQRLQGVVLILSERHGPYLVQGTSTASVLTRRELPSGMLLIDVLLRANIFPLQHKVQRRGAILEALFRISEGYYFGPHHLIMTSLLHFEEKVHQKKLQRADGIPLLFPRLLWSPAAVPAPPELPRDEQLPQAQQDEILTDTTPPAPAAHTSVHMPEAIHPTSPLTQGAPPVMPATPAPPPSSEPTVTMATIRAHQDQIIATQAQHTTILHQIQQHLSMQTPLGHDRSAPSEPLVPDEETTS
ncbi:hypothetical protein CK203_042120 [Vitis vinifera]|uniref:Uncharacterized protein n=1 Tax=Vitis vinifera TaxID=29760 RepID=A0A438HHE0_VITVI|nr:hypothetical protein CK203_042120 [Vitis vinifera]